MGAERESSTTTTPAIALAAGDVGHRDVVLDDGRSLHVYDTGGGGTTRLTVLWHHGSPQTGAPLEPLLEAAMPRGIRLVSYGRPSYGGSTPHSGRTVFSAAADVRQLADALGLDRFAVMGASGGGPHALACGAGLPDRIVGVVTLAGIAPSAAAGLDFFAGMADPAGLRSAQRGRDARLQHELTAEFDPACFIDRDYAALESSWASLGADVALATANGPAGLDGLVDDDVAFAGPWGFDLAAVAAPVLLVQGGLDRVVPATHAHWMLAHVSRAELWLRPLDGHISVLDACPVAMDWLLDLAR